MTAPRLICLCLAVVAFGALSSGSADAADGLSVTGPDDTVEVELDRNEDTGLMTGTVRLVVTTPADLATGLVATAPLDTVNDTTDAACSAATATLHGSPASLRVSSPAVVTVDLMVDRKCADRQGTLVLSTSATGAATAVAPATIRFSLVRGVEEDPEYENALGGAALLTLLVLFLMVVPGRWLWAEVKPGWHAKELAIDVPWAAKDSWVTNITALGALLGTLLAATGVIQEWLPGISLSHFLTMNLLFGGLILIAPVAYSASCIHTLETDTSGTRRLKATGHGWGIVASAALTVLGVFGQLSMILAMTIASNAGLSAKCLIGVGLGLSAATVGAYATRFVRGTLAAATSSPDDGPAQRRTSAPGPHDPRLPPTSAAL
ncbi:hypothetical protein [Streptomyces sp. NK15101]|uniref:hypothetical protein n=1 Tax=Streptomyces sp. NK15101 TaxID=2873261 RepID=UPI001CED8CF9|nr:hypothetical protein [Streptomyces sp. NK15101]